MPSRHPRTTPNKRYTVTFLNDARRSDDSLRRPSQVESRPWLRDRCRPPNEARCSETAERESEKKCEVNLLVLTASRASGFAPRSSRTSAVPQWLLPAAQRSGVCPSCTNVKNSNKSIDFLRTTRSKFTNVVLY